MLCPLKTDGLICWGYFEIINCKLAMFLYWNCKCAVNGIGNVQVFTVFCYLNFKETLHYCTLCPKLILNYFSAISFSSNE